MKVSTLRAELKPVPGECQVFVRKPDGTLAELNHLTVLYFDPSLGLTGASTLVLEFEPRKVVVHG